ncbi:MAG: PAS domain-containing protein [Archangium sp.]|nr:PAS domain-containing protein [Archangium sp.]
MGAVVIYALLTLLWGSILVLYVRQRRAAKADALIRLLLAVLILDAFKTAVESAYFGLLWGANYGLLHPVFKALGDPPLLTLVKLLNVVVAVVVLFWLVRRWVPTELKERAAQREELEASLRAARESEERFRLAASASRDYVWDYDLTTKLIYTSPRFAELLGLSQETGPASTLPWIDALHPDDRPVVLATVRALIESGGSQYEQRHRAVNKAGQVVNLHASGMVVRDANGKPTRFLGFIRDVTQEVAAEASRVQSQKLESLGLLAGGIAHDFNNLLTVLSGSLSLAEIQLAAGEPVQETLSMASMAVTRAATLTRQLLAYAGRSKLAHAPIDLNRLVDTMGELLNVSVSRKVKLERQLAPGLPAVMADDGQLQQVVMNLITNASEAIGEGEGTVTLRTELIELTAPPADVVGACPLGRVVRLMVSDTGKGMSAEVRARLFDPFFSTKGSGRGLGLAALAGIMRTHGGAIGLTSELGRGSTFSVYLPALEAMAPAPVPVVKLDSSVPLRARVLLVDDEAMLRRSARRLLQAIGCTVEEASTGLEAVEAVSKDASRFDVVLMDLTMPEMDGYEAARRLAVLAPALPVVLSSGYSAADDAGPLPPGVRALAKPYSRAMLEKLLRELTPSPREAG